MDTQKRHSRKRDAILGALQATKEHPSAEMLYNELKPTVPDLSLATVYRNLAMFREEHAVRGVCTVDGQERFDACVADHPHFVCTECGRVSDLDPACVSLDRSAIEAASGGIVRAADMVFYGVCAECK